VGSGDSTRTCGATGSGTGSRTSKRHSTGCSTTVRPVTRCELIPYVLNGLAAIAVETGEFERAATLLGAAAALQEQQGNAWPPDEAPHFERSRAAVTEALDHDQLERA
jgi:hypothetical protein